MEIIIGRNVEGENTIKVDNSYVSGRHCKIWCDQNDGAVYVEDLDSTNGTYVDGVLVKRKKISMDDKILLGGNGGVETTARQLFHQSVNDVVEDGHAIAYLRKTYEEYQSKVVKLKSRAQMFQMLRIVPTSLLGVGLTALGISRQSWWTLVIMAAAIVVCLILTSILVRRNEGKINALKEMHQIRYSCPKSHRYYGDRSWKVLEHEGTCQFCKERFR